MALFLDPLLAALFLVALFLVADLAALFLVLFAALLVALFLADATGVLATTAAAGDGDVGLTADFFIALVASIMLMQFNTGC